MPSRWSDDAFLDMLRQQVDTRADACVARLASSQDFATLFQNASTNSAELPATAPLALREFFAYVDTPIRLESDTTTFPDGVDHARLRRGETVFLDHAFTFCLVLLAKSLPEGYAAPCLAELLNLSGNLRTQPYRRLLGVLQLVVDVTSIGGFQHGGRALSAAKQARLMHAGIRSFVPRKLPRYAERHGGPPVNLEDMLGTIMGLSLLVIDGVPRLWDTLRESDAEDYYYVWRAFAVAMGIHAPGAEGSADWVPANLAEAREFYAAYERRHYEQDAAKNPDGVALANENLRMLQSLMPKPLKALGLSRLPAVFMTELIGADACRRVGLKPVSGKLVLYRTLVATVRGFVQGVHAMDLLDPTGRLHPTLSTIFLQQMITKQYGGIVTFRIPATLKQVRGLVHQTAVESGTARGTARRARK